MSKKGAIKPGKGVQEEKQAPTHFTPDQAQEAYIQGILASYQDTCSPQFVYAKIRYKNDIAAMILGVKGNVPFEIEKFFEVTLSKYKGNAALYFILVGLFTEIETGFEAILAKVIRKELLWTNRGNVNFWKCDHEKSWKYFGRIILWMSQYLAEDMKTVLQELRDESFASYDTTESGQIASLHLILTLLKTFPVCFMDCQGLSAILFEAYKQTSSLHVCNLTIRIIKQIFKSYHVLESSQFVVVIQTLPQLIMSTTFPDPLIEAIGDFVEMYPKVCDIMKFDGAKSMAGKDISPASLKTLPLMYQCSPKLFDWSYIKASFSTIKTELEKRKSKTEEHGKLLRILSDFMFALGPQMMMNAKELGVKPEKLCGKQLKTELKQYKLISFSLCCGGLVSHLKEIDKHLVLTRNICRALAKYYRRIPNEQVELEGYFVKKINALLFTSNDDDVKNAFEYLTLMNFRQNAFDKNVLLTYSVFLDHTNPEVRRLCAKFLSRHQRHNREISERLLSFVSTELSEEIREYVMKHVECYPDRLNLMRPLEPLIYDTQIPVRYLALKILCGICGAEQRLAEYSEEMIQRLLTFHEYGERIDVATIGTLEILAERHPQFFGHYGQQILNVIASDSEQSDTSLKLMTKLIPTVSENFCASKLVMHAANCVHVLYVTDRTAIGLELIVAIVNHFGLIDGIVELFDDLVELSGEIEETTLKFKLLDVLSLIGPQISSVRKRVKTKSLFLDYSTVSSKALSCALSIVFSLLKDESKKAHHQDAVDTLIQLVKIDMPDQFVPILIDYINTLLDDQSLSRAKILLDLIPPITSVLGSKAEKLITKAVDLICVNWDNIDIGTASKSVVWLMRQLPNAVGPHLPKIIAHMLRTLKTSDAETGLTILFGFESLGEYIKLVYRMVLPAMLLWMTGMARDTETVKTSIGILEKIIQESPRIESCVSEILRCLIVIIKTNPALNECAFTIVFELTVLLKDAFFRYLPEISSVFGLENNQDYRVLIECIKSDQSIPSSLSDRFAPSRHSPRSTPGSTRVPNYSTVMPTDLKLTDAIISSGKITSWFEKFIQFVFRVSPAKACVAFEVMARQHQSVRSVLFPIALAALYPKSDDVVAVFRKILTYPFIHVNILRPFLAALDHLEVIPEVTELPCERQKIVDRAIKVGNLELALRQAELVYEESSFRQKSTLVNLYRKLNMPFAASGLLRELSDKSRENLLAWYRPMDSFSKQSRLGSANYEAVPISCDDEFTNMIESFQSDSYSGIRQKAILQLFPGLRNDYEKWYPLFCQTALLFDIQNAEKYHTMYDKYKDSGVLSETLLLEREKKRIFDIWKVHFNRLKASPLASFYSLLVGERMVSKEELKPYYIEYLRTHLEIGAKAWQDMANVVMSRLDEQDPNRLLIECELSPDRIQKLEDLLKDCDRKSPEFGLWNKLLGKWRMENEDWGRASSNLQSAVAQLKTDNDAWLLWSKVNIILQDYKTALEAALTGLSLGQDSLQFALRVLSVLFRHGSSEIYGLFLREFEKIDVGAGLMILPQVIARIDSTESKIIVQKIVMAIQERDPHRVLYSLIVPYRSGNASKTECATEIIELIRQTKPSLVTEIMTISEELIKITKTWDEMWFSAIDYASKKHVLEGDVDAVLESIPELHKFTSKDPVTFAEASFLSIYGHKLSIAQERLEQYISTRNEMDLAHAWCEYVSIFRMIRAQIQETWSLQLSDYSPLLADLKDTTLAVPGHYSPPIFIQRIHGELSIFKSKQRPRKMTIIGSNGVQFDFLLKANEDTRLDERVMQLFKFISTFIPEKITTYHVIPLNGSIGLIEYVRNCSTLSDMIIENRKYFGMRADIEYQAALKECPNFETASVEEKTKAFEAGLAATKGDDVRKILLKMAINSSDWLVKRTSFTDTLAATSILGYVLGLGDRHLKNILMKRSARIVHIDFADCFEVAMSRERFPEKVPFRLTRTLIKAMDASGAWGTFSAVCMNVMSLLREKADTILGLLEVFQNDPLTLFDKSGDEIIERIEKKLQGKEMDSVEVFSPEQQVELLIDDATDSRNLAQMFLGWNAWW